MHTCSAYDPCSIKTHLALQKLHAEESHILLCRNCAKCRSLFCLHGEGCDMHGEGCDMHGEGCAW